MRLAICCSNIAELAGCRPCASRSKVFKALVSCAVRGCMIPSPPVTAGLDRWSSAVGLVAVLFVWDGDISSCFGLRGACCCIVWRQLFCVGRRVVRSNPCCGRRESLAQLMILPRYRRVLSPLTVAVRVGKMFLYSVASRTPCALREVMRTERSRWASARR